MTKSITELLNSFSNFLDMSWGCISPLVEQDSTGSFLNDWLQANWELMVEGMLGDPSILLAPYGDGADCIGSSSRIIHPQKVETHNVIILPEDGEQIYDFLSKSFIDTTSEGILFDKFVCWEDRRWYAEHPPFDYILGEYLDEWVVVLASQSFAQLKKIRQIS